MAEEPVLKDLSKFVYKRTLSDNSHRKVICVEGSIEPNSSCILLLEKTAFTEERVKQLCKETSVLEKQFINDVYGSYECFPDIQLNGIKTTIIHPATKELIKKYEKQPVHIIEETKDLYNSITLPYISEKQHSLKWVYNILEHKTETERIAFEDSNEDTGFILLPDLKWDGKQVETLYFLAICRVKGIKSLRDLNDTHLPLLRNILESGTKIVNDRYKIEKSRLRIYVHYQPSFYHFHVHFTYMGFEAPGISCERSHLLSSVINNIELKADYYQQSTLSFPLKQSDGLFEKYSDQGIVNKIELSENLKTDNNTQN